MLAGRIKKAKVFERNFECQIMDKKIAIRSESVLNQNTIKVYTDASKLDGRVGAGFHAKYLHQRWSQGHKARGQGLGQRHKKPEAKAQNSHSEDRPSPGQEQECSRSRPRTKDTGASVLKKIFFRRSPKKKSLQKSFSGNLPPPEKRKKKKKSKKLFKQIFQEIFRENGLQRKFSGNLQNFTITKIVPS